MPALPPVRQPVPVQVVVVFLLAAEALDEMDLLATELRIAMFASGAPDLASMIRAEPSAAAAVSPKTGPADSFRPTGSRPDDPPR